eukprot:jgi/Tetstr1/447466/TSEL_003723.t1
MQGRRNSKRRIPEGKEGGTPAEGIQDEVTKRMCRRACGASVSRIHFYDNRRWPEACAKRPPDTAAHVAAGGDGAPAAPYARRAFAPSGPGQTETQGEPGDASIP